HPSPPLFSTMFSSTMLPLDFGFWICISFIDFVRRTTPSPTLSSTMFSSTMFSRLFRAQGQRAGFTQLPLYWVFLAPCVHNVYTMCTQCVHNPHLAGSIAKRRAPSAPFLLRSPLAKQGVRFLVCP